MKKTITIFVFRCFRVDPREEDFLDEENQDGPSGDDFDDEWDGYGGTSDEDGNFDGDFHDTNHDGDDDDLSEK